jgi:hypothetical protein
MENIFILRKSGIIDYLLLDVIDSNPKDGVLEYIGREFIKILFLIFLEYREFVPQKKNELKGLVKKNNNMKLLRLILAHLTLLFDRKNKEYAHVYHTFDNLSFISLFHFIRSDLKA